MVRCWLAAAMALATVEAGAATWVVDNLAYTNEDLSVETHDFAWAIAGVNSATAETHVVNLATDVNYAATATFLASAQINGLDWSRTRIDGVRFTRGGGAANVRMDEVIYDEAGGGGTLEDCQLSPYGQLSANGNPVSVRDCLLDGYAEAQGLGEGVAFEGNAVWLGKVTLAAGTVLNNAFHGGELRAGQATLSGNTFDCASNSLYLRIGSGDILANTFTGTALRVALGTNLSLADVEMSELELFGDSNYVYRCAITNRLAVVGYSNEISQCDISDHKTTNFSISVVGDLNCIRYSRLFAIGGVRMVGDDCEFRRNLVFSNAYGIRLEGDRGRIRENRIGFETNGGAAIAFSGPGIEAIGEGNVVGDEFPDGGDGNQIVASGGPGIRVAGGLAGIRGNWVGCASNDGLYVYGGCGTGIEVSGGVSNALYRNFVVDSAGDGIVLSNCPAAQVMDCRIGVCPQDLMRANGGRGLVLHGSPRNDLWGNWVVGSGLEGLWLFDCSDTEIVGNRIGYVPELGLWRYNGSHGLHAVNSSNLTIGLRNPGLENVVAGNGGHGIFVERSEWQAPDSAGEGTRIFANWVGHWYGTNQPNAGHGIFLYGVSNAWIGGSTDTFEGNHVGGNGEAGIRLSACREVQVYNNDVGVYFSLYGNQAIPNLDGIRGDGLVDCIIGGEEQYEHNYVSGNLRDGIHVGNETTTPSNNIIQGNFVGVDSTGLEAIPNGGDGIHVVGDHNWIGGAMGELGVNRAGNVVSANVSNGLVVAGWSNSVVGNYVGVDDTGNGRLGNGLHGIVSACSYGCIGNPAWGNVVGANGGHGIWLNGAGMSNWVQNNRIGVGLDGTSDVGNGWSGIAGESIGGAVIGGTGTNEANYVGNNGQCGVEIESDWGGTRIVGNWIGLPPTNMAFRANPTAGVRIEESTAANFVISNRLDGEVGVKLRHTYYQWIEDNFIGFHPASPNASTQLLVGIEVQDAGANRIGGDRGNDVGAARWAGISIDISAPDELAAWGHPNRVDANRIGTGLNLSGAVTNAGDGISVVGARRNLIGSATGPNWIANCQNGIRIASAASNDVCGNLIGLAPNGSAPGNRGHGIRIETCVADEIGITSGSTTNEAGNVIVNSAGDGVSVFNSWRIGIAGNTIGHEPGEAVAEPNRDGVNMTFSSNCLVGLFSAGPVQVFRGNAIAGNLRYGVYDGSGISNWIGGNAIGVMADFAMPLPNGGDGICLVETVGDEIGNGWMEGYEDGYNVVSCNASNGIVLWSDSGERAADVQGNFIGTDPAETRTLGNGGAGIVVEGSGGNRIGYAWEDCKNVIVDNGHGAVRRRGGAARLIPPNVCGIEIRGNAPTNELLGNYVGVTRAGLAMGNAGHGIYVSNAPAVVVGGASVNYANWIGANGGCGIRIEGAASSGAKVLANRIGVAPDGISDRGNAEDGIVLFAATNVMVGYTGTRGNVVGFNRGHGVVAVECSGAEFINNRIGVDANATARQGNAGCGLLVSNSPNCTFAGNAIGANGAEGLHLSGPACDGAVISNNLVGISADDGIDLGNAGDGIALRGGDRNQVVGSNVVAKNFGHGIAVYVGARNRVLGNRAFGNALAAIHVATNAPGMEPNEGILPPAITNATTNAQFRGTFTGKTNEEYVLDLHYAWFTNASGAQAQFPLARTNFQTGADGTAVLDVALSVPAPFGSWLAANATDTNGNSSAFSAPVRVVDDAFAAWADERGVPVYPDGHLDDDGFSNFEEYVADTDPRNGGSFLRMNWNETGANVPNSSTGRHYVVEGCTNLPVGVWTTLTNFPGTGGDFVIHGPRDLIAGDPSAFGLRVKAGLPP